MSAIPSEKSYTAEENIALERSSREGRREFVGGHTVAMTGGSREHTLIAINIVRELSGQLRGRPCEAYVSDMRVKSAQAKDYYYPGIAVVCGQPEFEDPQVDTLLNPTVLVEILSPSTEAYDRGDKFASSRRIGSLREYLLVPQDRPRIERYLRQAGGDAWLLTETAGLEATVSLESIGCELPLREVYERVFGEDVV